MSRKDKVAALIVAGGSGRRMTGGVPKQYVQLGSESVLAQTIKAFKDNKMVDVICVVTSAEHADLSTPILAQFNGLLHCEGGVLRQDSVRRGLEFLSPHKPDVVLIHDGARPFVSHRIINSVIERLEDEQAVIPAVKVKDTIKRAQNNIINETVPRDELYAAQTPQGFRFDVIYALHHKNSGGDFTDDASMAEAAGIQVKLVEGDYGNYKITTDDDLKAARMSSAKSIRVGNGFDVHRFTGEGEKSEVILCGTKIPYDKGLVGHSDADCAWHALTDAILGAIGLGDIGEHFPDTDAQWKGADSGIFLRRAVDEVKARGGVITNVDITVICEAPKMKKYKPDMKKRTAELLEISEDTVNVKATTTERLGFLGRGEGLAVLATATVSV